MISAYALGVVAGAPAITILAARAPRRGLLIALMSLRLTSCPLIASATPAMVVLTVPPAVSTLPLALGRR